MSILRTAFRQPTDRSRRRVASWRRAMTNSPAKMWNGVESGSIVPGRP